ncbi:alpha/beta fold hydrolase [Rhizobium sp. BK602]|uniref:alpha/beta fold hydrolase n=1 Tax=Rhizobium sp. BK602 TaxID=2586986 RepID=UPI00160BB066|nr:alpha/beta fold hydrolase [Rhizobium sp. BK602]MBB3610866.1 pyruvate dehydrogenase E2 component (dihydrolipoamide acetyltransferase) [Rhizobium sp. BK602]
MAVPISAGAVAGEYMETFVILEWRVSKGQTVAAGDVLLTIETAKAAVEIEAPCDGVVSAVFAEANSEVPATAVLCLIGADAADIAYEDGNDGEQSVKPASEEMLAARTPDTDRKPAASSRIVASPAARRAARAASLDLARVSATSPSGRIKLRDVARMLESVQSPIASPQAFLADEAGPLKIHVSGTQTGDPIFLIHGFASDSLSWYPLERELRKSHPVYRLDLPNHGASPKRRIGGFADLVREVRAAFDTLGLEKAHVIGHSLGGALAIALADTRERQIASLSLLAPGGLGPKVNGDFIRGIAGASKPESLEAWLKVMVHDPSKIDQAFVRAAFAARTDPVLRASQALMGETLFADSTQGFDLKAALHRIVCPTRIIWGRNDAVLEWRDVLRAPGRMGLHLLEDVGHVPQMEASELVLEIITALIRSV